MRSSQGVSARQSVQIIFNRTVSLKDSWAKVEKKK